MSVNTHTLNPLRVSVSNLSDIITNLVNATQHANAAPAPVVPAPVVSVAPKPVVSVAPKPIASAPVAQIAPPVAPVPVPVPVSAPAPIKLGDNDKIPVNYRSFTYGNIMNAFANTIQTEKDPDRKKKMEMVNQLLQNAKTKDEVQVILEERNFDMGRNATGFIVRTLTDTFGGTRKRRIQRHKKTQRKGSKTYRKKM